jgi:hypothetical protein
MVGPAAHVIDQIDLAGVPIFRVGHHELQARGIFELSLSQRGWFGRRLDWGRQGGINGQWFQIVDHDRFQLSIFSEEGMNKNVLVLHREIAVDIDIRCLAFNQGSHL